jgi:hypothetical protein
MILGGRHRPLHDGTRRDCDHAEKHSYQSHFLPPFVLSGHRPDPTAYSCALVDAMERSQVTSADGLGRGFLTAMPGCLSFVRSALVLKVGAKCTLVPNTEGLAATAIPGLQERIDRPKPNQQESCARRFGRSDVPRLGEEMSRVQPSNPFRYPRSGVVSGDLMPDRSPAFGKRGIGSRRYDICR